MHAEKKAVSLSDGEWRLMNLLWEQEPRTITELTHLLQEETGWGKHTVITMLNRLEKKGAVAHREGEKAKKFFPLIERMEAAKAETRGFLERVYEGSLSMMVNTMVSAKSLSREDIAELYEILKKAEEDACD